MRRPRGAGVKLTVPMAFPPSPTITAVFGEVGLTGEVRGVLQAQARAREAQTLGFKKLIVPESNKKGLEKLLGVRVVGVHSLDQAMDELF